MADDEPSDAPPPPRNAHGEDEGVRPDAKDPAPRVPSSPAPPMVAVADEGASPEELGLTGPESSAGPERDAAPASSASSDRVTEELPRRPKPDDDAPTLEIEPAAPSIEVETLRRPDQRHAAEAHAADDQPTDVVGAKKPRNLGKWIRRVAVALVAVVTALAIVLAVAFDAIAHWYVTFEAERRGVTIDAREMTVEWGRATFWDATLRLDGVPALAMHADKIEVEALGLVPTRAKMRGVEVQASSMDAIRQGLAFGRTHAMLPVQIEDLRAALGGGPGGAPVLEAKVAAVSFDRDEPLLARKAIVTVARPKLVIGPIDAVADARGSLVQLGLGDDLAKSPVKVDADVDARQVAIDLPATPASTIAGWMGRAQKPNTPPWPGAFSIKAKLTGTYAAEALRDFTGHVDATLIGLVPPTPPELNGIATGSDTVTSFDFRIGARDEGIALDKLGVVVGRLRLDGTGRVVPRQPSFEATATLRGAIPCRELVGTVAVSQLGAALGGPLGSIARNHVSGNVDVTVAIRVDGENVASPDVRPSAAIGCRLSLL